MTSKQIKQKTITPKQKALIEAATKRVVKNYSKTLELLAKE